MDKMKKVIMRRQEDAGHTQLDNNVVALRAASFYSHMEALGVKPDEYNKVYEVAARIYAESESKGPFGVDYMIRAVQLIQETGTKYTHYSKPERKAMVSCTTCQGSKISYKRVNGKIVGLNRNEDGTIKGCEDCT